MVHQLITPPKKRREDLTILDVGDDRVTFARHAEIGVPGRYGLWVGDSVVKLGDIVHETAGAVTRAAPAETVAAILGKRHAALSGNWLLEPEELNEPLEEVLVETSLGPAPAWILGAQDSDTWCIQVHGRATTRREVLRGIPSFTGRGIPCVAISYRNDGEAPRSKDGRYRLGHDEWHDVDAAIAVALSRGAKRVIVMGWSMGGAIALKLARKSKFRRRIAGIVLDSPVARWAPTLKLQTGALGLPVSLVHTATRLLESPAAKLAGGEALRLDDLDSVRHAGAYTTPILLLHSVDDGFVPPDGSREFAQARPDIVDYREWDKALHTKLWNLDPQRYQQEIGDWLDAHEFTAVRPK